MPAQSEEKNDAADELNGEAAPASSGEAAAPSSAAGPADPVAEAKAEAVRMKEQWMRTAADFDNFRKRARRELEETRKAGKEDLLKEFLPVFDNLERAIQSAQRATDVKAVAEGLQMVLRQYLDTLSRGGISKVPAVGAQFDPTYHEAIQQVETDDQPPGTVVAEVQPGYLQGDRLIRAAMVVVAKPKAAADPAAPVEGEGSTSE
ncbi:MAG: nucleotide exchange factor GrpE [Labilithrix sp.]|nr:nucleotide exchange factor GrpE [Labilithrix sp.]